MPVLTGARVLYFVGRRRVSRPTSARLNGVEDLSAYPADPTAAGRAEAERVRRPQRGGWADVWPKHVVGSKLMRPDDAPPRRQIARGGRWRPSGALRAGR